jgi:predicted dehydrogenase
MRALLERSDVAAVLILDSAWHGLWPVRFAVEAGKPAYVAAGFDEDLAVLKHLQREAAARDLVVMPELRLRATPAGMRLRELTAARVGPIERLDVLADAAPEGSERGWHVHLFDWCCYVLQSAPVRTEWVSAGEGAGGGFARIHFRRATAAGQPVTSDVACVPEPPAPEAAREAATLPLVRATAVCARGSVRLLDRRNVIWSAGGAETEETLNEDRSSVDALLDLFARRVVGGLVPVADVGDVCRAMSMWEELRGAAM